MAVRGTYPRKFVIGMHSALLLGVIGFAWMASGTPGFAAVGAALSAVASAAALLAAARTTWWRTTAAPVEGGTLAEAPAVIVGAVVCASAGMWLGLLAFGAAAVRGDLTEVRGIGYFGLVIGALGIPDVLRLATGKLYRWRIQATAEGLLCQGYRRRELVPWDDVRSVHVGDKPVVELKRAGGEDLTFLVTPYDLGPEDLADRIRQAAASRR